MNGSLAPGLEWVRCAQPARLATRRVAATLAAVSLSLSLALVLASTEVRAAPLEPQGEDWEGLSQFVRLAASEVGAARVVVRNELELDDLKANDAIVLVHPERDVDPEELSVFMRAGGRVVLLDDYGAGDKLLAHFRIRRVPLPAHPAEMLRQNAALAIAEPASEHDAVRDVERVVTNHATGLSDTGLAPLLVVHGRNEPDVLLAVAGVVGKGRFLVVGDASIAMNAMLRFPGNHALARAIVRYATEASEADVTDDRTAVARGGAAGTLYVLANDAAITGRYSNGAAGPIRDGRRALSEALASLRRGLPPLPAYIGALFVGTGVVLWATRRAGRTHKPSPPRFVRPLAATEQGGVAGHAAILAGPGASPIAAAMELRSAVEERIAARLGLDGSLPHEALVASVRAAGLLGKTDSAALARLLAEFAHMDPDAPKRGVGVRRLLGRVRPRQLVSMAGRARDLLAAMDTARHGTIAGPT